MALLDRLLNAHAGPYILLVTVILRFCQLLGGCLVVGLYEGYVDNARTGSQNEDPHFLLAVVAGGLGAVLSVFLFLPIARMYKLWVFDLCVFAVFCALLGVMTQMYLFKDPMGDYEVHRMQIACFIDLANTAAWFLTLTINFLAWFLERRHNKRAAAE